MMNTPDSHMRRIQCFIWKQKNYSYYVFLILLKLFHDVRYFNDSFLFLNLCNRYFNKISCALNVGTSACTRQPCEASLNVIRFHEMMIRKSKQRYYINDEDIIVQID